MEENKLNLSVDTSYDTITPKEVVVDESSNTMYEKEDLLVTPFDVIKATAEKLGQTVLDPNPSCKSCQGRGYTGREAGSKAPIPCQCIYTKEARDQAGVIYQRTRKMSRAEKRAQERQFKKMLKKQRKGL